MHHWFVGGDGGLNVCGEQRWKLWSSGVKLDKLYRDECLQS